jgi:hypothetical protein
VQANAEARRAEENERQLEKVRQMNNRVPEAEKKRGEMEPHDMSSKEAKLQAAEERKAALLKETQEKGAAEIAKVRMCMVLRFVCCRDGPPSQATSLPQSPLVSLTA